MGKGIKLKKINLEDIQECFKLSGFTCLEDVYINQNSPLKFKCECGKEDTITWNSFKKRKFQSGCVFCRRVKSIDSFIVDAHKIHDNVYDYSKSNYTNAHTNIEIICKEHGSFLQRPDAHLHQKQGCPKCGMKNRIKTNKTNSTFISQAKAIWGNKYSYDLTKYISKEIKIKYECREHGVIEQLPSLHLKNGCNFCSKRGPNKYSLVQFIDKANSVHGNTYDYFKVKFKSVNDKIIIICNEHGEFEQRASNHINLKNGCPQCNNSKLELELSSFVSDIYQGEIRLNDRKIISPLEIDIYLPNESLGIEFNGNYWHSDLFLDKNYHLTKTEIAESSGLKLIQIFEYEWDSKKKIVQSRLNNLLGKSNRIFARNTTIIKLNKKQKDEFLNDHHIQGTDFSSWYYGLVHNNKLVACMTFGKSRFDKSYNYELLRYCNRSNLVVVGGASKLLNRFTREHNGSIVSYADRKWSSGNLYRKLGFSFITDTTPGYRYYHIPSKKTFHRLKFQKHKIEHMPYYDDKLSANKIMKLNSYTRIWDCGNSKWELR